MSAGIIMVHAVWDAEVGVWVATSDDVPGLATEAATLETLRDKVLVMIPELLEANRVAAVGPDITVRLVAEQTTRIPNPRLPHPKAA